MKSRTGSGGRWLVVWGASVLLASCSSRSVDGVGGETNWLAGCKSNADCEQGSCICGMCTKACDSIEDCIGSFSGGCAATLAVVDTAADAGICEASIPGRICLPGCGVGISCGVGFHCVDQVCVRGEGDATVQSTADAGVCSTDAGARTYEDPVIYGTAGGSSPVPRPPNPCGVLLPDFTASPNAYGGPPETFFNALMGGPNCPSGASGIAIGDGTCFYYGSCNLDCTQADDCPPLATGTAQPACVDAHCMIPCTGKRCADGMVCVPDSYYGDLCLWPYPTNSMGCPCYGADSPRDCPIVL